LSRRGWRCRRAGIHGGRDGTSADSHCNRSGRAGDIVAFFGIKEAERERRYGRNAAVDWNDWLLESLRSLITNTVARVEMALGRIGFPMRITSKHVGGNAIKVARTCYFEAQCDRVARIHIGRRGAGLGLKLSHRAAEIRRPVGLWQRQDFQGQSLILEGDVFLRSHRCEGVLKEAAEDVIILDVPWHALGHNDGQRHFQMDQRRMPRQDGAGAAVDDLLVLLRLVAERVHGEPVAGELRQIGHAGLEIVGNDGPDLNGHEFSLIEFLLRNRHLERTEFPLQRGSGVVRSGGDGRRRLHNRALTGWRRLTRRGGNSRALGHAQGDGLRRCASDMNSRNGKRALALGSNVVSAGGVRRHRSIDDFDLRRLSDPRDVEAINVGN